MTTQYNQQRPGQGFDVNSISPHGREQVLDAIPTSTPADRLLAARYLRKVADGEMFARMLGLEP